MTKKIPRSKQHISDDPSVDKGLIRNEDVLAKALRTLDLAKEEGRVFRKARRSLRKETHKLFSLIFDIYFYATSSPEIAHKLK